jgi:hypothetical protein
MKNFLLFIVIAILLNSCDLGLEKAYYFNANVNGVEWAPTEIGSATTDNTVTIIHSEGPNGSYITIHIVAELYSGMQLEMADNSPEVIGTYESGTSQYVTFTLTNQDVVGSVTIDEVSSSYLKGTFYFTAKNSNGQTVEVTEGKFGVMLVTIN